MVGRAEGEAAQDRAWILLEFADQVSNALDGRVCSDEQRLVLTLKTRERRGLRQCHGRLVDEGRTHEAEAGDQKRGIRSLALMNWARPMVPPAPAFTT